MGLVAPYMFAVENEFNCNLCKKLCKNKNCAKNVLPYNTEHNGYDVLHLAKIN